jgi:hypothetical protein
MQKQELLKQTGNTMKGLSAKMLALASAVVLGGSMSARATVDMTFTWSGTLYEAG